MNTSSTTPTTAMSRWTHFSRKIRRSLGVSLSAGLSIALLLGSFIVGCKEEGPGIVNVCVAPMVIRTSPANGASNEPLNKIGNATESAIAGAVKKTTTLAKTSAPAASASAATVKVISATFNTPMDPNSISASTFTVWQGSTPVLGGVTYSDTTAMFVVPNGLDPNLTYTCTITTGARDLAGTALADKYVWIFTTAVVASPTVSSTDPANAATGVVLNKQLAATFSKTMDASTFTSATFTLKQGSTPVQGFVSYSGTTAIFAPSSNLLPNRSYSATITSGVKDLAGNALAGNYVWNFTTGASAVVTSPTVSFTDPANAATGVALNQKLAATFSTAMDASTFTTPTFILRRGTTSIQGFVSYSGTTAIFAPSSILAPNTAYTATITTEAKDLAGNALASDYVWSFTTGTAVVVTPPAVSLTDPLNGATGVALNQKLAATFTKTMDASTLTSATFTLKQGTTAVSGFVSYSGTTAIFAPTSNLAASTVYTATITTGAKDLAGNALANNFVWNFTTGAAVVVISPTVSFTDPVNVATGVALNQKLAATFSTTMDASTFNTPTFTLRQGATSVQGFVSYSGTTAIFAPASNLLPNLTYSATITTAAKDLAGNALATDYVWSFTTGAAVVVIAPTVSFTDPVNTASGVALNQQIAATFSTVMDASTIHTSTFTVKQGTTSVSGFVSYSGTTAIFAPASNLTANTAYTATITTEAKDLAGNALASSFVWSFTTGAGVVVIAPTVSSTDPANSASGVALNQKIAAIFSKTMNASMITTSTFTLKQGTTPIQGFVSYSGVTAIFAPTSNLTANTAYTATITTGVRDLAGNALANDYVWNFTTGAAVVVTPPTVSSTDPANTATGVASNKKIAATFSKTMDASTFNTPTFILRQGATSISGYVSYSGTTAIFTPASDLAQNTTYTATITTAAKDLAGNALANDYVWSFTTAVTTPPTVIRTDPVNTEVCVALNKHIGATFSRPMNASTITTAIFTLMETQGARFVSGVVSYTDTTAVFTPLINLTPNTTYTATITTEAWDLAGNPMASNYVWTFTTVTPYTVTLSSSPLIGGTTSGGGTFNSCSSITVSATPNAGYVFTNWTEGAAVVSTNANYTFTLGGNRTLVANFALAQYTVTVSSNPAAGGNASGGGTFNSGASVTVTAIANAGYAFTNWTEGVTIVSTNTNYTFTLSGNRTLVAHYAAVAQYIVSLSSNPLAGGLTGGSGTYDSGQSVTITATANSGYTFTNWTEGVTVVSTNATYTFFISANRTLVANFTAPFTVTVSSNPLAGGTTGGGGTFNLGSSVTVTAAPNSGYTFTNWTEGVTIASTNATYTFTLSGNRTLVANFALAQYTVTLSSNPLAGGTTGGSGTFSSGSSVTVTAAANAGYTFTNWTEGITIVSTNANYTFTLSGNRTLVANFTTVPNTVTLSSNPLAGGTTGGSGTFSSGSSVTVTAAANAGYTFTNWTEGVTIVSTNANYTFTLSGNRTLVANFQIIQYTIAASAGANGNITPSGSVSVNYGANQSFTITPSANYHVADVLVDGVSAGAVTNYTFTNVTAAHTIAATFAINTITIAASAGANGSITPSGSVSVNYGANQSFTITPSANYHVADVLVDGVSAGAVTNYTFTNVTAAHTIAATFAINTITIAASAGANGSITPSGSVSVNYGANQSFTITPSANYHVADVLVDGVSAGAVTNYTFTNVTAAHTIAATFAINTITIAASAGANGSITPSGSVSVNYGANQSFTITPSANYHVADVLVDGVSAGAVTNYTFTNVTAAHTIAATFAINTITIAASAGANGSITPSGSVSVNYGANQSFTITPSANYHVADVLVDGVSAGAVTNYTFTNVTAAHTIAATFAINTITIAASAGANGSITPSGSVSVNYGANQSFTITPSAGYHVAYVLVDGAYVGGVTSYTFTNVTSAHTIVATFVINGQAPVVLGTAGRFAILSDQAIGNTGIATSITGDVGQSPISGSFITGLTSAQVSGHIYTVTSAGPVGNISDPVMLNTAKNDASNAYGDATAAGRGVPTLIVGNLAGQTLYPGLYTQGTIDLSVGATVTLDAQGDSSAVFIISSAATIQLNDNSVIQLANRAQARNVFWVAASAVTLNGGSTMTGTIIANTFIFLTGAKIDGGRALIPNGGASVTLDQNIIALPLY